MWTDRRRRALAVALTLACAGSAALAGQRAPFQSSVDVVALTTTVTGAGGKYISDLSADDFTVFEDGKPQPISFFQREPSPLAVSILIDSSGSMQQELAQAQRAASDFVTRLRADDLAQVVDFDRRIEVLQPFTGDHEALQRSIHRLIARGSTSMYNAVYIALRELGALASPPPGEVRRDVIVVLSDGEDTSSVVTYDHLLDAVKRSPTVIYTIGLGLGNTRSRPKAVPPQVVLRTLAQESGGRLFLPRDGGGLSGVYQAIADELASQYVIGYVSNNAGRPGWRTVSVRVAGTGIQTRTRSGYYSGGRR